MIGGKECHQVCVIKFCGSLQNTVALVCSAGNFQLSDIIHRNKQGWGVGVSVSAVTGDGHEQPPDSEQRRQLLAHVKGVTWNKATESVT